MLDVLDGRREETHPTTGCTVFLSFCAPLISSWTNWAFLELQITRLTWNGALVSGREPRSTNQQNQTRCIVVDVLGEHTNRTFLERPYSINDIGPLVTRAKPTRRITPPTVYRPSATPLPMVKTHYGQWCQLCSCNNSPQTEKTQHVGGLWHSSKDLAQSSKTRESVLATGRTVVPRTKRSPACCRGTCQLDLGQAVGKVAKPISAKP